ncbi:hypothetical protein [Haloferula sp. A504]|uniref:hypothetical protein n=1 Tax=Haloferula sp. A504 TaxID=3373601 RepID=UPI0031CA7906|nr:hypothetical protein [Verrucomicrobiaceae bacterium E54]
MLSALWTAAFGASMVHGDITYLDAVEGSSGNTFATGGSPADFSWLNPDTTSTADDDQWKKRPYGNGGTVFQALHSGNTMPELTTRISGLSDGSYDVWVFFWDGPDSNQWTISAGLTPGSLTTYSFDGPGDSSAAVAASTLTFNNPPMVTEDVRTLYGVKVGQASVAGGNAIELHVDNLVGGGSATRTWYDGVGYGPANPGGGDPPDEGLRLFGVEFNRDDALGSPSQSQFRVVSGSTTQNGNAASYVKTIGPRQVTISQPGAVDFEFRGANGDASRAIPGGDTSLSFLVADFIATREGAINLEITGLPAGDYVFRSYHLDPFTGSALGFAQGLTTTTPNTIEARTGGVMRGSVQPTALGSAGLNTTFINDSQVPTLIFPFTHDGSSPLVVELRSTKSNGSENFLLLNGFELFEAAP